MDRITGLVLVVSMMSLTGGMAQEPGADAASQCRYSGQSFSAGIVIAEGSGYLACSPNGDWVATDRTIANCLYAGDFYGFGSLIAVSGQETVLECDFNGRWIVSGQ